MLGVLAISFGFGVVKLFMGHMFAANAHNLVAVPLATRALATLAKPRAVSRSSASKALVLFSSGFFLYDVAASVASPIMLFHAIGAGSVFWFAHATGNLHHAAASHMMWELSTPFVHARERLAREGLTETNLYRVNGIAMMIVFFAVRNLGGAIMLRNVTNQMREAPSAISLPAQVTLKTAAVSMNLLNAFWFSRMVRGALRMFRRRPRGSRARPPRQHRQTFRS